MGEEKYQHRKQTNKVGELKNLAGWFLGWSYACYLTLYLRHPCIYSLIHPANHVPGTGNTEVTETDGVTTFIGPATSGFPKSSYLHCQMSSFMPFSFFLPGLFVQPLLDRSSSLAFSLHSFFPTPGPVGAARMKFKSL